MKIDFEDFVNWCLAAMMGAIALGIVALVVFMICGMLGLVKS